MTLITRINTNFQRSIANSEVVILSRAIEPENGNLSPEAGRSILEIRLPEPDRQRLHELSAKAAEGSLSDEDQQELENYRHVGRLLELMKSKARLSLKSRVRRSLIREGLFPPAAL